MSYLMDLTVSATHSLSPVLSCNRHTMHAKQKWSHTSTRRFFFFHLPVTDYGLQTADCRNRLAQFELNKKPSPDALVVQADEDTNDPEWEDCGENELVQEVGSEVAPLAQNAPDVQREDRDLVSIPVVRKTSSKKKQLHVVRKT